MTNDSIVGQRPIKRSLKWAGLALLVLLVICLFPARHFFWRYHLKRYVVVRPQVFYRVGQPTEMGLRHLIRDEGVRTVVSTQLFDPRLKRGWFDLGKPDGALESQFVSSLGAKLVQWPTGDEACWPFPSPRHFEAFFELMDDPANLPVAIHCMGGRHRTGTFAALYRLEYDHWPVEQTLGELYSYRFGGAQPIHEHNLRTYWRRPAPRPEQWRELLRAFASNGDASSPVNYPSLVRYLMAARKDHRVDAKIAQYLDTDRAFAVPLAQRLIRTEDDPLVSHAINAAERCLDRRDATPDDLAAAASLIADFGTQAQQARLLEMLRQDLPLALPSPRFQALAHGVMNRYTRNRLVYLQLLLGDQRKRPEHDAGGTRYCDTAVARVAVIIDKNLYECDPTQVGWEHARELAQTWIERHPNKVRLGRLVPPTGPRNVRAGGGSEREDLSRMRR